MVNISEYHPIPCSMDDKLITHILSKLLPNAIKHLPVHSTIKFSLNCQHGQAVFEI